jgi:hypothetical protein
LDLERTDELLIAKAAEFGSAPILQEFQVNGWSEIDTMLRERTVQLWSMDAQQWADGVAVEINNAVNKH